MEASEMLETCTLRFFHDFNTKGNRQRLAATTSSMFRIFSSTFLPSNSQGTPLRGLHPRWHDCKSALCSWRFLLQFLLEAHKIKQRDTQRAWGYCEGAAHSRPTSFLCHRGCIYWRHMRALQLWLGLTSKMYPISWCHGFSRNLNRSGRLLSQATTLETQQTFKFTHGMMCIVLRSSVTQTRTF